MFKILVINPGSTSTKIAVYEDEDEVFSKGLNHNPEELIKYDSIISQLGMRKNAILDVLIENNININNFDAIVVS